jgi:plastocyanin
MRRILATTTVIGCALMGLAACGDDDASGGSDAPVKQIKVRFADGKVTPNGERIEVEAGQQVEFIVAADEPGEIHIHSEPEHELHYDEGEEKFEIEFDRPGVVEVESHDLEEIIVQLEVK